MITFYVVTVCFHSLMTFYSCTTLWYHIVLSYIRKKNTQTQQTWSFSLWGCCLCLLRGFERGLRTIFLEGTKSGLRTKICIFLCFCVLLFITRFVCSVCFLFRSPIHRRAVHARAEPTACRAPKPPPPRGRRELEARLQRTAPHAFSERGSLRKTA